MEETHLSRGGLRQGSGTNVPRVRKRSLSTSSPTKSASETPRGEIPTIKPLSSVSSLDQGLTLDRRPTFLGSSLGTSSVGLVERGRSSYRVRERPRLSLPSEEGNLLTRGSTGSRRTWRACRRRRQRPRRVQLPPPMPSSGRVKRATSSLIRDPRGLLPAGFLDPSRSLVEGPRLARGPRTGAAERAPLTVASLGPDRRVTTVTASSRTPKG